MEISDFRSDTVTRPDQEMRQVIAQAEVGDDVFGDDPTVHKLEEMAAGIFGREAALFVPSGTMANQIGCRLHTQPGEEIILHLYSHIYNYEVAGLAALSGLQARPLEGEKGAIPLESIEQAIRYDNVHVPRTSLICLENTHNMLGGRVLPLSYLQEVWQMAQSRQIAVHIDGARIFNAAVASQTDPKEYGKVCHTLSFCLSKGLGAPVGSLLVGDLAHIDEGRRHRKLFGGGMRQAGILAAAGILALERRQELAKDHELGRHLADRLSAEANLPFTPGEVETNILICQVDPKITGSDLVANLKEKRHFGEPGGPSENSFGHPPRRKYPGRRPVDRNLARNVPLTAISVPPSPNNKRKDWTLNHVVEF